MAYTNFEFYKATFCGDLFTEGNSFKRWEQRASDYMDTITFMRLQDGLPTDGWCNDRVQKCVCALAEIFYQLRIAQDNAFKAMQGVEVADKDDRGVKSKSSGSESITYMTGAEMSSGAKEWSAIYGAAGSQRATNDLLLQTATEYLSSVCGDDGVNLLFAGVRYVR